MKRKGFTLIELLGVIVVLAVIALITTPVILGVIEKAKKGAFKNSVYGLIESTNIYIAENLDADNISFICNGKDCITENDNKLSFKGNVPKSGSIKVDKQHIEVEYITDGTYCAYGTLEDLIIDKGCANIDITKPVIDESKLIISSTTSSISIRILEGFAIDPESGVKEYRVTLNRETKTLKEIGSLTFEGLEKNRSYPIKIEVENGKGLIVEVKKESSTLDFENPTITLTNTPTTAVNGYLKSQVAKVTYNSTNITSPQYYVKTTRVGTSSVAVTKTCGTGTTPSTCTSVTSTTTLSANTWYQVSGNVNVTYSTAASETATIYAITYDGTNYSGAATGTISKIDTTSPTVTVGTVTAKTNNLVINYIIADSESGVNTPTCKYGTTSGTYDKTGVATTTTCTMRGLAANKTYYYQICVSDKVGNSTCKTGSSASASMTNPTITLTNTPTTAAGGYLKSQVAKVTYNSTNITSPQYYVKTTRVGTSSIAVTKTCGTGTTPSTCTSVTSTTTLSANTWYQVSGNVNITYNKAASATATIYAITYDGTNYSGASAGTISKIDTTGPKVTVGTVTAKTNNLIINYTIADSESGVNTPTCKYGTTSGNYTTNASNVSTTGCSIKGLTANKTYYYQICVSDKVGNSTCKAGSSNTASMINPSITLTNTPTTAAGGYLKSQVAKVTYNSTNISSPQYYVKTTRVGTSSVAVTKTCGTGTTPSTCTSVTSTTTLSANTWYQISGNVNVTYNKTATSTANIYAITYDGKNYSGSASGTVSKIDATSPTIGTISFSSVDCHNFTTNLTVTDANSGLSKIVWYYKLSSDNSYSNITDTYTTYNGSSIGTTSSVTKQRTFTFGSYNKTYNVYARVYDVSGNYKDTAVVNVTTKAPVATIGSTGYSSVSNAVSASSNGNTIVLQKNTSETITIPSGKSISINLNSKTLSSTSTYTTLVNNGTLKVYGGTIENSASSTTGKAIINQGNLTITSGTYRSNKSGDQSLWNASGATSNLNGGTFSNSLALPVSNEGTMNINGATITGSQGLGQYASTAVINFNSGTVTANSSDGVIIMAGKFYMYGGTVIGNNSGVWIPLNGSGTILVAGGSVTGNNYDGISKQGSGNIYIGNNSTCPTKIQGHNWGIYSPGGGLEFRCSTNLIGSTGAYYVGS